MSFSYVDVDEAIASDGTRMVVVGHVPSPWGESAKGLFQVEGLPFKAVRLVYDSKELVQWAGQLSGPVVVHGEERPRSGWAEILLLAERLAERPTLLPSDPEARAWVFGLGHEILGEQGLAWSRRLHSVHLGLRGEGGFAPKVAGYLAPKYGYSPELAEAAHARVIELLKMFTARLSAQRSAGRRYLVGDALTAADIYLATTMALFAPLPESQCAMRASNRSVFETLDEATRGALDPILLEHRDTMYDEHLELPLNL